MKAMKSKLCIIVSILIILSAVFDAKAQEGKTISGVVTGFNNILLKRVKVSAVKSGETTLSDSIGRFSIKSFKNDVIIFSASGFKERRIKVGNEKLYKVDLTFNNSETSIKDAVNNGHISQDVLQKALKAVQLKNVRDFSKYTSIFELISNEVYEVRVTGNSVTNKKVKSFNSSPQVLYVVNDKIVSDISYINPTYVSKIEFIDDVGASLYGMMGANGVLKITLK
jgi:hypothetical protein